MVPTAAGKASNFVLSFLELSRKLKQDGPDADLVEVVGKAAKALENDPDAGLALEALPELLIARGQMKRRRRSRFRRSGQPAGRVKRQKMAGR